MSSLQAKIQLVRGTIHVNLFADQTPITVANFVNLARRKYYDGLAFHRVIPDFMVQGGCPEGSGRGGPGYKFDDEIVPTLRHQKGTLAMANAGSVAGKGTNGSQFFITHLATPWLDGKHTVFGAVASAADQTLVDAVRQGDKIESLTIDGDYSALFDKVRAQLDAWNAILDKR